MENDIIALHKNIVDNFNSINVRLSNIDDSIKQANAQLAEIKLQLHSLCVPHS